MRITPTREQLAYLASIGVGEDTLSQPGRGSTADEGGNHTDAPSGRALFWVWFALLAVVLVLVAWVGIVRGAEPPPSPSPQRVPENDPAAQRTRDFEARLRGVDASLSSLNERVNQSAAALRTQLGAERTNVRMLVREELWVQADETAHLIDQLKVLASLLTVLVVVGGVLMGKRLKQLEMAFLTRTPEGPADGLREANGDKGKRTPTSRSAAPRDSSFKPVRPVTGPLPSTRDQLERIIQDAAKLKHLRVRLHHPEEPWTMGMATAKGNVRAENQDYGLCFRMADNYDVLIVADGCGGIPFGQRAAYLASVSAAVSVVRTYGTAPLLFAPGVRDAVAQAIKDAAHRLAVEGDKLNVSESRDGLRTTLIVLVGNRREVAYAYIGDGGGCVVRASGAIERFLTPQKVNELAMNVLAASLGPTVEGEFVTGTIKRMPGDLILVGTDGVFDRVGPEFPKDVLRGCIQSEGDLQATADHVIDELAAFKDGAGYICDDNLSLGLLGDGTSPRLPQGFWSTTPAQDTPVESPPGAVETAKEGAG